jgi:alkylation response protein AidB-like acyl-CoA dehydrogenase
MLKILGTEIRQELTSLLRRALGPQALPFPEDAMDAEANAPIAGDGPQEASFAAASYFNNRKLSIFGGSNEIQKNIIAKTMLDA